MNTARESAKLVSSHLYQALEFYEQNQHVSKNVRPVLQYYSYLNLAVATILAHRPTNFEQYRRHGVEDRTHSLQRLELSSVGIKVNKGAVPLFHSILSDAPLQGHTFRISQLAAGFHLLSHELADRFGKNTQAIMVIDKLAEINGVWRSQFGFSERRGQRISKQRLEAAMPLLKTEFDGRTDKDGALTFLSKRKWSSKLQADRWHKGVGIKLINFGGHEFDSGMFGEGQCRYHWRGVSRIPLLPTLSSILLLSFCLSSIARYRPMLLRQVTGAPIQLIVDTFLQEADAVYIPAIRNLLYREEFAAHAKGYI